MGFSNLWSKDLSVGQMTEGRIDEGVDFAVLRGVADCGGRASFCGAIAGVDGNVPVFGALDALAHRSGVRVRVHRFCAGFDQGVCNRKIWGRSVSRYYGWNVHAGDHSAHRVVPD